MMLSSIQPAISNFIIDQNCEQTLCRPAFEAGNYERGKKSTLAVFLRIRWNCPVGGLDNRAMSPAIISGARHTEFVL